MSAKQKPCSCNTTYKIEDTMSNEMPNALANKPSVKQKSHCPSQCRPTYTQNFVDEEHYSLGDEKVCKKPTRTYHRVPSRDTEHAQVDLFFDSQDETSENCQEPPKKKYKISAEDLICSYCKQKKGNISWEEHNKTKAHYEAVSKAFNFQICCDYCRIKFSTTFEYYIHLETRIHLQNKANIVKGYRFAVVNNFIPKLQKAKYEVPGSERVREIIKDLKKPAHEYAVGFGSVGRPMHFQEFVVLRE
ncbi:hypothetical protein FGB62_61g172 [Gracilaria domingensis]|nr:hypothetical protein FGB62_61g172 [Gracilaria domingensis]